MKYLQVRMEDGEWKVLAHTAVERGLSISELVRGILVASTPGTAPVGFVGGKTETWNVSAPVEFHGNPLLANIPVGGKGKVVR